MGDRGVQWPEPVTLRHRISWVLQSGAPILLLSAFWLLRGGYEGLLLVLWSATALLAVGGALMALRFRIRLDADGLAVRRLRWHRTSWSDVTALRLGLRGGEPATATLMLRPGRRVELGENLTGGPWTPVESARRHADAAGVTITSGEDDPRRARFVLLAIAGIIAVVLVIQIVFTIA